jgi:hypothetical protein
MILLIALTFIAGAASQELIYDQCDSRWAADIIYEYHGNDCMTPPGCIEMCTQSCWQGEVNICKSSHGALLTLAADVLNKNQLACGVSPCTPGALNKWLRSNWGYLAAVIVNMKSLNNLGLRVVSEINNGTPISLLEANKSGKDAVFSYNGQYYLLQGVLKLNRFSVINGLGQKSEIDVTSIHQGWILERV